MNILGIHYGHNATVTVVQDGRLTFAQSEERLNRIKNSMGFPSLTLAHVAEHVVDLADVDVAVLFQESAVGYLQLKASGFVSEAFVLGVSPAAIDRLNRLPRSVNRARWSLREAKQRRMARDTALRDESAAFFSRMIGIPASKITAVRHHDAHAYAAVPNIAGDDTLVFTLDGSGDGECATVQRWRDGSFEVLSRNSDRHSLGFYYAYTTAIMGMRPSDHEFKVMGLAPYASRERVEPVLAELRKLIRVDDDGRWQSQYFGQAVAGPLERAYRHQRFDVVAGAIQALAEELIERWVRHWVAVTGCRRLALGGGVFMNVKAAQLIAELDCVDSVYVVPSAGDESCAVGAAVYGHLLHRPATELHPIEDLYLGMDFDDAAVEAALVATDAASRYDITRHVAPADVAALLARGEVVARCAGRMEFGARSLGNRSILADPSRPGVVDHINAMIKSRDFWMPFAPSILDDEMARYVEPTHTTFAPHMTITFDTTAIGQEHLKAAVHPRDKTARPQQVVRSWNPWYHDLIAAFRDETGIGGVLNTSFNLHGEPNVCSPTDAISTADRSGLRHLLLNETLLEKRVAS